MVGLARSIYTLHLAEHAVPSVSCPLILCPFPIIYRALGHNARFEPHAVAATAAEPLGAAANAVESTQIDQPAGKWNEMPSYAPCHSPNYSHIHIHIQILNPAYLLNTYQQIKWNNGPVANLNAINAQKIESIRIFRLGHSYKLVRAGIRIRCLLSRDKSVNKKVTLKSLISRLWKPRDYVQIFYINK